MIISDSKKFIFIWNYRVAGSSIVDALNRYRTSKPRKISGNHAIATQIRDKYPEEFATYYKFGFVRNPWDWQVSQYNYIRATKGHFQRWLVSQMTFEEYIHWRKEGTQGTQKQRFTDENGKIIIDFIGRYENLVNDFARITKRIGAHHTLRRLNSATRNMRSYTDYYTPETRDIIAELFKEDIDHFKYKFD